MFKGGGGSSVLYPGGKGKKILREICAVLTLSKLLEGRVKLFKSPDP